MYPDGSEPFESRFGYPASQAVIERGTGSVEDFYCKACGCTSEIADADEKLCKECGNKTLLDLSQSEGNLCPKCGSGVVDSEHSLLCI